MKLLPTHPDAVRMRIETGMSQFGITASHEAGSKIPAMLDVVASSINIMWVPITRSRLAGNPADVTMAPRLADPDLMEFRRPASRSMPAGVPPGPQLQARPDDSGRSGRENHDAHPKSASLRARSSRLIAASRRVASARLAAASA